MEAEIAHQAGMAAVAVAIGMDGNQPMVESHRDFVRQKRFLVVPGERGCTAMYYQYLDKWSALSRQGRSETAGMLSTVRPSQCSITEFMPRIAAHDAEASSCVT
jgi:hypothetical protein